MKSREGAGFSLPELLIVSAIFSGFLVVSYLLLHSGLGVWRKTAGSQDVDVELLKARDTLRRDLLQASFVQCRVSDYPSLTSTDNTGDVLWMLSAEDPATGELARDPDGVPFWQRNVVYYCVVPTDHDKYYGTACGARRPTDCPHKVLVRRVVDDGPLTRPNSRVKNEEKLLETATLNGLFLIPTDRRSIPGGDRNTQVVAAGVLDFKVSLAPDAEWPEEVRVQLVGLPEQVDGKRLELGKGDPHASSYAHSLTFSVQPGNTTE